MRELYFFLSLKLTTPNRVGAAMFFLVSLVSVRFVSFFPDTPQEFYACLFLHSLSVLHARADRCVFSSIYAFLIGQSGRGCSGRWLISQNSFTGEVQSLGVTINLYPWPPPRPRCRHSVLVPQDRVTKWRCLMVASLNAINHTSQPASQVFAHTYRQRGHPLGLLCRYSHWIELYAISQTPG